MQLIIAGFHRSGTSLLTQYLHGGGLFVGDRLLGAMPSNPYGHFEDRAFLELHRSILNSHGDDFQWDAPFAFHVSQAHWRRMKSLVVRRETAHADWGFKDPRVCLFMGHWKYLMPSARTVIVYRDPGDSVRSLESRHASGYFDGQGNADKHLRFFREPDHGLKLWDTYNRALVSFAEAHLDDCLVMPFTHLTSGVPVVDLLNERFGSTLTPPDTTVFDPSATHRRESSQRVHDPAVAERVATTWRALESLAERTGAFETCNP